MTPKPTKKPIPPFTDDHLRAIHQTLFRAAWQTEFMYDARREALQMLNAYFGPDDAHLKKP